MGKGGFSWKRATGVTNAKRKIAKATGVPTSKSGRKRKLERTVTKGCLGSVLMLLVPLAVILMIVL